MAETKGGQATAQQKTKEPQQGSKRDQQPSKGIQTANQQGTPYSGLTRRFADEMGRLFGDFGLGRSSLSPFGGGLVPAGFGEISRAVWSPQIEVFEREGQLIVRADRPGLSKDDVKIHITDDQLIIEGERRQEREENEGGFYRSERIYGSFNRGIPLPESISDEDVKASFRNGVLEITMPAPKREQRHRKIEIGDEANSGQSNARAQKASR